MPAYKKYDPRADSLVVETRTEWDPEIDEISDADRLWLSEALHGSASDVENVVYERAHTGFTRIITVTRADIERLYAEKFAD